MSDTLLENGTSVFGGRVPVREESLDGRLGYYDTDTGEIVIGDDQSREGKLIVLVHELLHLSEIGAINVEVLDGRLPEEFVARTAYVVAESLCEAGLVDLSAERLKAVARERK